MSGGMFSPNAAIEVRRTDRRLECDVILYQIASPVPWLAIPDLVVGYFCCARSTATTRIGGKHLFAHRLERTIEFDTELWLPGATTAAEWISRDRNEHPQLITQATE